MVRTVRDALLLAAFILATKLPFLAHPFQGDDIYYLYGARHARVEPLHPHHAEYVFQGRLVSMAGHPHPPLNAFFLSLFPESEVPLRLAYLGLMLVAALGVYAIARKLTDQPLYASLLFAAAPVFWVSGNTFESDILLLACLMPGIALFLHQRERWSAIPLFLAGLAAYQAVLFTPILWLLRRGYLWACAPIAGVLTYQLGEKLTTGKFPVEQAATYFQEYGLQRLVMKITNALALTGHLAWLTGPVAEWTSFWPVLLGLPFGWVLGGWFPLGWLSIGLGIYILWRVEGFCGWWVRIFFAGALVLFFAGAARYLLPIAPALAILAANRLSLPRLRWAIAAQTLLALGLAYSSMRHWDAYRQIAESLPPANRTWIAGEWGLRYYVERRGGQPIRLAQGVAPGDLVVKSELGFPVAYTIGGGREEVIARHVIHSPYPLQLTKSAWYTTAFGLGPFGLFGDPIDTVTVSRIADLPPALSSLPMNAPEAERQIAGGVYELESGRFRWMSRRAEFLLAPKPGLIRAVVYLPPESPARRIRLLADGAAVLEADLAPGLQTLRSAPIAPRGDRVRITLECDAGFIARSDGRELALVLQSIAIE
jgi:hypothetical protein